MIDFSFKKCNCDISAWEEIVVKDDENFNGRTVIYYHCDECDIDFAVADFNTNEILLIDSTHGA